MTSVLQEEESWNKVETRPQGYHTVTPYMAVRDCVAAIDFYRRAFGAEKDDAARHAGRQGRARRDPHRRFDIDDVARRTKQWGNKSPLTLGGSPMFLMIYVPDVDAAFKKAIAAGATEVRPVAGPVLRRPFGNAEGPVRLSVDAVDAHRGCVARKKRSAGWKPSSASIRRRSAMEAKQLHRGRLIDHVHLIARDIEATKRFYVAALGALGRKVEGEGEGYFWSDELFVSTDAMATTGATHVHLAFQAPDRATVDRFHAAALAAGGRITASPAFASSTTPVTTAPS